MNHKTRVLAGLALGCMLSTPAAFAEQNRGFYFGVWGGTGDVDLGSKRSLDEDFSAMLNPQLAIVPIQPGTNLSAAPVSSTLDDTVTPWGAQVGYRFNDWVAVEVGYVDLGEASYTLTGPISGDLAYFDGTNVVTTPLNGDFESGVDFTSAGITASVLGMLPLGQHFDLHVRGGIYYAETRVTQRLRYIDQVQQADVFNLLHRRTDVSQTELFAGLGGAWNINDAFTLRLEYQRFFDVGDKDKGFESDVNVFNFTVLFK
ncbi:outer membrane beta-barrel protein [Steroidobacter cummioxidans]|uniref:outer membrane beta-barrel protein n=1 Tax=Steroidobacter cummioxidans TaxID=1803913 RepID=UPI000E3104A0|nr:outer membrane beta-barrel protein [Steroidobacter cummioxidans]